MMNAKIKPAPPKLKKKPNIDTSQTVFKNNLTDIKKKKVDIVPKESKVRKSDIVDEIKDTKPRKVRKNKQATVRHKKRLLERGVTLDEIKTERERLIKEHNEQLPKINKNTDIYKMVAEGEDKVIAQKIYILATKGYSRKKIRSELNIPISMWHNMMVKYAKDIPVFKTALTRGEDYALEEVEESLKSRALGYDYVEETFDDMRGMKTVTKHVPGDVKAMMFILTNKKPDEYKMKRDNEMILTTKNDVVTFDYTKLPPETLKQLMLAATNQQRTDMIKTLPSVTNVDDEEEDEDDDK
jgi:hypothetical protein